MSEANIICRRQLFYIWARRQRCPWVLLEQDDRTVPASWMCIERRKLAYKIQSTGINEFNKNRTEAERVWLPIISKNSWSYRSHAGRKTDSNISGGDKNYSLIPVHIFYYFKLITGFLVIFNFSNKNNSHTGRRPCKGSIYHSFISFRKVNVFINLLKK